MIEIFSTPGIGKINEDYVSHDMIAPNVYAIAVSDGMGGLDSGADAARLTSENAVSFLKKHYKSGAEAQILSDSLGYANSAIGAECVSRKIKMGSAIAVAIIAGYDIHYTWLGDVHIYRQRGESVMLMTHDHLPHPENHSYLTRCLNGRPLRYSPEIKSEPLQSGDVIMFATDGYYLEHPNLSPNEDAEYRDDATLVSITI